MDVLLGLLVLAMPAFVLAAVGAPPLVMGLRHAWRLPAVGLWLITVPLVAAWFVAGSENIEWADRTGGEGNAYAGSGWLAAAIASAAASTWWTARRRRQPA